jgi:hypothetical protein
MTPNHDPQENEWSHRVLGGWARGGNVDVAEAVQVVESDEHPPNGLALEGRARSWGEAGLMSMRRRIAKRVAFSLETATIPALAAEPLL